MNNEQTTDVHSLAEKIMAQLRKEVELLVQKANPSEDTLERTEERSRLFAKRCGGIAFLSMIEASLQAQKYGHVGDRVEGEGGTTAYFERYESRWVRTHLGRFRIKRAYYWDPRHMCGVLPLDERWNLDEREPSPSLRRSIGMLSAEMPFVRGRRLMLQTALVDLPEKRLQESGEAIGEKIAEYRQNTARAAEPFLRDASVELPCVPVTDQRGTLYVQMDGGRINTTSGGWREPKVATLYWGDDVVEESKDRRTILHKEYIATLGDADELGSFLWEAACRWEWWTAQRVVVLGDGAPWIWNRAQELFPNAIQILDLYHAKEHIWKVARLLYGGSGKHKDKGADNVVPLPAKDRKTSEWAHARCSELDNSDLDAVLANLRSRRPKQREVQEAIDNLIHYLEENRGRTDYATYRDQGLSVGSGSIESGIKNVVNLRMKGCGMRWAENRAEDMLHLRAAYLSDKGPFAQLKAA